MKSVTRRVSCNIYDIPLLPGGSHLYALLSDFELFDGIEMKTKCLYTNVLYVLLAILFIIAIFNIINITKRRKDRKK